MGIDIAPHNPCGDPAAMSEFLALDSLAVALAIAFFFGLGARFCRLPPMVGFLLAGFALNRLGMEQTEALRRLADFGVILLLFTIGLKLRPKMLTRKQILGTTVSHMALSVLVFFATLSAAKALHAPIVSTLGPGQIALLAFALSFSSTVFAAKIFEEKGELSSVHGQTAIGILILQDIAAVAFLVISTGALPSIWAFALIGLVAVRPLFGMLLERVGHGEMIPLFGLFAALVLGAASFKLVGLKPDLGALVMGMLMARERRAAEVAESLMSLKDIFLIGFFLNIGLGGIPTLAMIWTALGLVGLLAFKLLLFFGILVALRFRARTALLCALGLSTYSEFGLIVGSIAVDEGMIAHDWLLVVALALTFSFLIFSPINAVSHSIYARFHDRLRPFEFSRPAREDRRARLSGAEIVIFGMGRLGSAIYRTLEPRFGSGVLAIETDWARVRELQEHEWNVIHGDATDSDFWVRAGRPSSSLRAVLLAMPRHDANLYALRQIRAAGFGGFVAALARYPDDVEALRADGADIAFDVYGEAGAGFAADVIDRLKEDPEAPAEVESIPK